MAFLGSAVVRLGLDNRDLIRGFEKSVRKLEQFSDVTERLGQSLSIGLTAPLTALAVAPGRATADIESLRLGLDAIAPSAESAAAQYERLVTLAKLPALGFEEAIAGSVRLQAVGFSAAGAERSLKAFANAIALTGGGKAELASVTVQLGQLSSKGRVLAQDLRPIIEAAPAVGRVLREAFGTVDSEEIQKLGLSTEDFLEKLLTGLEGLEQRQGGLRNAFDNLADSAKRGLGSFLGDETKTLTDGINSLAESVEYSARVFAALDPATKRAALGLSALAAATGPTLYVVSRLSAAFVAAKGAMLAMSFVPAKIATGFRGLNSTLIATQAGLNFNAAAGRFQTAAGVFVSRSAAMSLAAAGTSRAVALMKLSLSGIAGFLTGPVGIALALTAAAGAFVKFRVEAAKARVEADEFRASLMAMDEASLLSERNEIAYNLTAAQEQVDRLSAKIRRVPALSSASGFPIGDATETIMPAGLEEAQRTLTELQTKFHLVKDAIIDVRAAAAGDPLGDFGNGLSDTQTHLERLTDKLRTLSSIYGNLRLRGGDTTAVTADLLQLEGEIEQVIRAQGKQRTADLAGALTLAADLQELLFSGLDSRQISITPVALKATVAGFEVDPAALDRFKEEMRRKLEVDGLLDLRIKQVPTSGSSTAGATTQAGRDFLSPLESLMKHAKEAGGALGLVTEAAEGQLVNALYRAIDVFSQLSPLGVLASLLNSALDSLAPAVQALLVPIEIVGQALGSVLVPVLELLFPVFKGLGYAVAIVAEGILRVADALATGIGAVLIGLGKAINLLPGSPGDPLIKAGRELAKAFDGPIDAMEEAQKRILELSWEDAMKGVDAFGEAATKTAEALANVPELFDLALRRRQAALGAFSGPGSAPPAGPVDTGGWIPTGGGDVNITVNVQNPAPGVDGTKLAEDVRRTLINELAGQGGTGEFRYQVMATAGLGRW